MATLYSIKDWDSLYENNRTRDRKALGWVPMPNTQDGDGYTELVDHPDGAAHYGIACALILLASKCRPRGTLVRANGTPHDPVSMARITRLPEAIIADALPRLVSIRWLDSSDARHPSADSRHDDAALRARAREGKKEGKKERTPLPPIAEPEPVTPDEPDASECSSLEKIDSDLMHRAKVGRGVVIGWQRQNYPAWAIEEAMKRVIVAANDKHISNRAAYCNGILMNAVSESPPYASLQPKERGQGAAKKAHAESDKFIATQEKWERDHREKARDAAPLSSLLPGNTPQETPAYKQLGFLVRRKEVTRVIGYAGKELTLAPDPASGNPMVVTNGEKRPFGVAEFLEGGYEPYHGPPEARASPKEDARRENARRQKIQAQKVAILQEARKQ